MNLRAVSSSESPAVEDAGAFEATGYKNAVLSYLKEFFKDSEEMSRSIDRMSVHEGLKMIRKVIEKKSGFSACAAG